MPEYISKDRAKNILRDCCYEFCKKSLSSDDLCNPEFCELIYAIEKERPADVAPVRHGRWLDGKCTVCGWEEPDVGTWDGYDAEAWIETPYCPNCGAIMDLK